MPEAAAGDRIDRHIAATLDLPRNQVRRWIEAGRVRLEGASVRPSTTVAIGEQVVCRRPSPPSAELMPQAGELSVLFADDHLVVIDKPAGLVVHPGAGRDRDTLVHRLLHRFPEVAAVGSPERPGIVHRLDQGTTGVLAVALSPAAYRQLAAAFSSRRVLKIYLAVVFGQPSDEGTWDRPIGRDPRDRKRMAVRADGRAAVTRFRVLHRAECGCALLGLRLETGRTHQIRVHAKAAGHPLVGDPVYAGARFRSLKEPWRHVAADFGRPALHAWHLRLPHPTKEGVVAVTSPPPADLVDLWTGLGGRGLDAQRVEDSDLAGRQG